jgi:hypothetical protein
MAQATGVMTAAVRQAAASVTAPGSAPLGRDPKTGRMLPRGTVVPEPPVFVEAGHPEPPVEEEPDHPELPDDEEDDQLEPSEHEETAVAHATVPIERVSALLTEALRLGLHYHLVERQPDGTLLLAGQERLARRASSDCTCQQCTTYSQQHWICVVCHSGPHDWYTFKPQYEHQALKPGGIEGTRQAACSMQCAKDYMASLGRQSSGVAPGRGLDPTLALP